MGNPVIFVHGIGDSARVWNKFAIADHPTYYISFSHPFIDPSSQVPELTRFIDAVLQATGSEKVVLVCHSMGGLVARSYLVDNEEGHRVEGLILLGAPNLGSIGLSFNWLPLAMLIAGMIGFRWIWPLLFCAIGLIWEFISYRRGVLLLSPAAWVMRPNSRFLKELNAREMPTDLKYVVVLSDARDLISRLVNLLLFHEGSDGAIPLSSQKLSKRCVPNFDRLDYRELLIGLPHFQIPKQAEEAVLRAIHLLHT